MDEYSVVVAIYRMYSVRNQMQAEALSFSGSQQNLYLGCKALALLLFGVLWLAGSGSICPEP